MELTRKIPIMTDLRPNWPQTHLSHSVYLFRKNPLLGLTVFITFPDLIHSKDGFPLHVQVPQSQISQVAQIRSVTWTAWDRILSDQDSGPLYMWIYIEYESDICVFSPHRQIRYSLEKSEDGAYSLHT